MKTKLVTMGLLLAASVAAWAEMRTWTFKSGAALEAELTGFPDAESANVKRLDGKILRVPFTYLSGDDRTYLAIEQAKQWKKVSVDELLGTASAGYYDKCKVSGEASGTILIQLMPSAAEAALRARKQQADEIASLTNQVATATGNGQSTTTTGGRGMYHRATRAQRAQAQAAAQENKDAKAQLDKLKADYAANLKKTKEITTVLMKNTGAVYAGLPVWECKDARKAQ